MRPTSVQVWNMETHQWDEFTKWMIWCPWIWTRTVPKEVMDEMLTKDPNKTYSSATQTKDLRWDD